MAFYNYPVPGSPDVFHPAIPFIGPIPGGLTHGKMIFFTGRVPDDASRFSINFMVDSMTSGDRGDTGLHLNPRFDEGCIVRNHKSGGGWGSEEREGGLPLSRGEPFEIIVLCQHDCYMIAVNGEHFCEFEHRLPKEGMFYMSVEEDVEIHSIRQQGGPGTAAAPVNYGPRPVYQPSVPHTSPIFGGMFPGRAVWMSAIPSHECNRFNFNLMVGEGFENTVFHCDFRVSHGGDHRVIVCNNSDNGVWQSEERHTDVFPIRPGVNLDLLVRCEPNGYEIYANGEHLLTFDHRFTDFSAIDHCHIDGDLEINTLSIQ